jgi:ketosteroid isomerase-like protein
MASAHRADPGIGSGDMRRERPRSTRRRRARAPRCGQRAIVLSNRDVTAVDALSSILSMAFSFTGRLRGKPRLCAGRRGAVKVESQGGHGRVASPTIGGIVDLEPAMTPRLPTVARHAPIARRALCALAALAAVAVGSARAAAAAPTPADLEAIAAQVSAAETAFAQTMADRTLDRFAGFVAEDAVFRGATLRIGRAQVVEGWKRFFDKPAAPFSWAPDLVTVAADGRTAISTGLARAPDGTPVSRFTSIWRRDADGQWRVIADQGVDAACTPAK